MAEAAPSEPAAAVAIPAEPAASPADVDVGVVAVKAHKQPTEGYRPLCCGNSGRDLLLIPLCLVGVYALTGALFALCTRAVLQTDDTGTALWTFFVVYVTFVAMLGLVLATTAYEKRMLKAHADDDQ